MAGDEALGDVFGPLCDPQFVGHEAAAIGAASARPACLPALAQAGEQFAAQFAARQRVEREIDALVADALAWVRRFHAAQSARDLRGRPSLAQMVGDAREQRRPGCQLAATAPGIAATPECVEVRAARIIPISEGRDVAAQFPANRSGIAFEHAGDRPHAQTPALAIGDRQPLDITQMLVAHCPPPNPWPRAMWPCCT